MARKPDPKRVYDSRRSAQLSILTSVGVPQDRADAHVAAWETHAAAEGRERLAAAFWEGATAWIAERRDRR